MKSRIFLIFVAAFALQVSWVITKPSSSDSNASGLSARIQNALTSLQTMQTSVHNELAVIGQYDFGIGKDPQILKMADLINSEMGIKGVEDCKVKFGRYTYELTVRLQGTCTKNLTATMQTMNTMNSALTDAQKKLKSCGKNCQLTEETESVEEAETFIKNNADKYSPDNLPKTIKKIASSNEDIPTLIKTEVIDKTKECLAPL